MSRRFFGVRRESAMVRKEVFSFLSGLISTCGWGYGLNLRFLLIGLWPWLCGDFW